MKIIHTNLASVIEPLKAPFGFKGRYGVELTQVIARIESEKKSRCRRQHPECTLVRCHYI